MTYIVVEYILLHPQFVFLNSKCFLGQFYLTYLLTYSLHDAEYYLKSSLSLSLSKSILLSYGTRRFITVLRVFSNICNYICPQRHYSPEPKCNS
jgi:hypothetical protein